MVHYGMRVTMWYCSIGVSEKLQLSGNTIDAISVIVGSQCQDNCCDYGSNLPSLKDERDSREGTRLLSNSC